MLPLLLSLLDNISYMFIPFHGPEACPWWKCGEVRPFEKERKIPCILLHVHLAEVALEGTNSYSAQEGINSKVKIMYI